MAVPPPGSPPPGTASAAGLHRRAAETSLLAGALAINWWLATAAASTVFSWTSLALFAWTAALVARANPRAAILLLPVLLTRLATMLSLIAIEAGAYMPEVNRAGMPGDAAASFAAFTAIFLVAFTIVFGAIERPLARYATSPILDATTRIAAWPVLLAIAAWGALAAIDGARVGFPLIEGVDRFFFRRFESSAAILYLLDNKFLVSVMLGTLAFRATLPPAVRRAAGGLMLALTALYFLFGDKFFTILTEVSFFLMPLLLQRPERLGRRLLRGLPLAAGLLSLSGAATFYIYSDYGRLPAERTITALGERVAGQGELWYVAAHDYARPSDWNASMVDRYVAGLSDREPAAVSFRQGLETYFFIQHYAPAKLAASFRGNQGWVQLTMGYEAIGLVMFGYVGVSVLMVAAGLLVAIGAAYLQRAFLSGFVASLLFAGWTYLQIYFAVQQGALWPVAGSGQLKRFLLFATFEIVLLAINRTTAVPRRRTIRGAFA